MLGPFLRWAGLPVTYLGASLDGDSLLVDLQRIEPAAPCLSATTRESAAALSSLYLNLAASFPGILACGGSAFVDNPDAGGSTPGVFLGTDVRAAVDTLIAMF